MMSKLISCHSDRNTSSFASDGPRLQKLNVRTTEHLIAEILCRLPVKILLRFRCVSKPWCSLIDSPRFVKAHLKRSIECKTKPGIIIKSFVSSSVDFDSLHNNATTAVEIDEPLRTLLYATGDVGSCNGLHCLYNLETDLFLWNPAMRKCRKLPTAPAEFLRPFEFDQSSLCGFGYDAGNDDYKVLRIVQPDVHDLCGSKATIYSLKTNSWKRLQNISGHFIFRGAWGIFMGGALHWITVTPQGSPSILAFDLGVENYREVALPRLQNKIVKDMNIVIFSESLCMLEYFPLIRIDVWAMKDYGVGNSWCKLFSVEQPKVTRCCMSIRPIFYSKSREDVLLEVDSKEVVWYNLKRKRAKTVNIANLPEIFDLEVYPESLVSPDYNISCGGAPQLPSQPQEKKKQQQQQQRNKRDGFLSKGFKLVL
ncbi:F-box and associated interaction domain protein [Heracleum sosnowskyi]|uniref:F-box and associated interaction domain protein n=1 Tax=Heracleum sosnowskyi TaxID=360622 RepID=A0AAD8HGT3_9APIA|nr:F-box and associated interaction domain protein [Heracleum sosnowskyi]